MIDVVAFTDPALQGTEELNLGMREMRRRLSQARYWYPMNGNNTRISDVLATGDASSVLVILNSALLVSDNLLAELVAVMGGSTVCALPSDPRGFTPGVGLDYASRPGFDRFVARLAVGASKGGYDNRDPWIYLVERQALADLAAKNPDLSWSAVPDFLRTRTVIAYHAFVHSYSDYYSHSRAEMLRLLPADTVRLLDVGGGVGNFAQAFVAERGGRATLLELNPRTAEAARARGLEVLVGDFQAVPVTEVYDGVALLDVLEHLVDPLAALVKARQVLRPGGVLLLSVPNVGHWSVVWDLLEGKFDYLPVGILCNTHLRFFTRHGLETLIADAGYRVERWDNVPSPPPSPFADFLGARATPGVALDLESLSTECFHVLARRD